MGVFLTSAAICTTSFLLGILFTSALWDSSLLFNGGAPPTEHTLKVVEAYYLTWWNGAVAVKSFLHIVLLVDFVSLVGKVARFTDDTLFFSGGSLLLLVLVSALYITVTVPTIRLIARDPLDKAIASSSLGPPDIFSRLQGVFARSNSGPLGDKARENAAAFLNAPPLTLDARTTQLSVMCAANTLIAILLVGVVILQIGEWWVQVTIVLPIEMEEKRLAKEEKLALLGKETEAGEKKTQ